MTATLHKTDAYTVYSKGTEMADFTNIAGELKHLSGAVKHYTSLILESIPSICREHTTSRQIFTAPAARARARAQHPSVTRDMKPPGRRRRRRGRELRGRAERREEGEEGGNLKRKTGEARSNSSK